MVIILKTIIFNIISKSLENGVLKSFFLKMLKVLVSRTTNTVDDRIVEVVEKALNNEIVDEAIEKILVKGRERAPEIVDEVVSVVETNLNNIDVKA